MKVATLNLQFTLFLSLILFGKTAYTQQEHVRIVSRCNAEITMNGSNVLYRGIDNEVTIQIKGIDGDSINAAISPRFAGKLEKISPGRYKVLLSENNFKRFKVNVSQRVGDGKVISKGTKEFRVLELPTPVLSLNGNSGPSIKKEILATIEHVSAKYENFGWQAECSVVEYDYIYSPKRGQLQRGHVKSVMIPEDLQGTFKNAMRGDMLIISGVKVKSPSGAIKSVWGSLIFTVE